MVSPGTYSTDRMYLEHVIIMATLFFLQGKTVVFQRESQIQGELILSTAMNFWLTFSTNTQRRTLTNQGKTMPDIIHWG